MHSLTSTTFIYAFIATLFSSLISPALSAPIPGHGYHTGSQKGYPVSKASSPWSHVYTYGKLADKFLMVNDAYLTDGSLWQNSLKVYNAVSAYIPPSPPHYHQPPQFKQPAPTHHDTNHVAVLEDCQEVAVDEDTGSRATLIAQLKKYATIKNLALSNMQKKIASLVNVDANRSRSDSRNVEGEGKGKEPSS